MKNAAAAVVGLLLEFKGLQDGTDQCCHGWAECFCPAAVIGTVFTVNLLVVLVLRRHMRLICDVFRIRVILAPVTAEQAIVCITDPDFGDRGLENCGLSVLRIEYGIVVAIELDVVIIRNPENRLVFTWNVFSAWQRPHVRLIVFSEKLFPCRGLLFKPSVIDGCYYFCAFIIDRGESAVRSFLLKFLQEMRFKDPHMIFYRRLSLLIIDWR